MKKLLLLALFLFTVLTPAVAEVVGAESTTGSVTLDEQVIELANATENAVTGAERTSADTEPAKTESPTLGGAIGNFTTLSEQFSTTIPKPTITATIGDGVEPGFYQVVIEVELPEDSYLYAEDQNAFAIQSITPFGQVLSLVYPKGVMD